MFLVSMFVFNNKWFLSFKTSPRRVEIAMNSLLIAMGSIALIVSFIGALASCIIGRCCWNKRVYLN